MIEALPVVGIGQGGILLLVVWLVLTDRLVPGRRLAALEKRIETQDQTIRDLTAQNGLMLESAIPTVNSVLTALQAAAGEP